MSKAGPAASGSDPSPGLRWAPGSRNLWLRWAISRLWKTP